MRKLFSLLGMVLLTTLCATALIPWHTNTTVNGVTYYGTFHFDAPAFLELDTIEFDQNAVPTSYSLPEKISFNGTEFDVTPGYLYKVRNYGWEGPDSFTVAHPLAVLGISVPDTLVFNHKVCIKIERELETVVFNGPMDSISVKADHIVNYSASTFANTLVHKSITFSDNVEKIDNMICYQEFSRPDYSVNQFYEIPQEINFNKVKEIKAYGLRGINAEKIEFMGKLEKIGEYAFKPVWEPPLYSDNNGTLSQIKILDLHESPAPLTNSCLQGQYNLQYLRSGAKSFSIRQSFGKIPETFPIDTLIMPNLEKLTIHNMKPHQYISAPKIESLEANSFISSVLVNTCHFDLNVKSIKSFAFMKGCTIDTLRFDRLRAIEKDAFTDTRIGCLMVTDSIESIAYDFIEWGPESVIISENNKLYSTIDDEWLINSSNPYGPLTHYGPMPKGEEYYPESRFDGYNVDVTEVGKVVFGSEVPLKGWKFYNYGDSIVDMYINQDLAGCQEVIKKCDGKFEYYIPENVYPELMTVLGFPPGYPAPYHPYNFSNIEQVDSDTIDGPVEYFNLNGVRVREDRLTPGLYIRRQGQKAEKVIIK